MSNKKGGAVGTNSVVYNRLERSGESRITPDRSMFLGESQLASVLGPCITGQGDVQLHVISPGPWQGLSS
jgi:hypothetical protein